ncbi:MAG: hypothetical protein H0W99_09090 [Acidobacteria bacterium]|nr:hypothetical protein [Acidobacteriota bacterium]
MFPITEYEALQLSPVNQEQRKERGRGESHPQAGTEEDRKRLRHDLADRRAAPKDRHAGEELAV